MGLEECPRLIDLLVRCEAEQPRQIGGVDGPAGPVTSPESVHRDRGEKFLEYETAGVREYWLVDPLRREGVFYQLGEDGRYHPSPIDADGWYHSLVLPGFRLRVGWLWQRPLPPVADVVPLIEA